MMAAALFSFSKIYKYRANSSEPYRVLFYRVTDNLSGRYFSVRKQSNGTWVAWRGSYIQTNPASTRYQACLSMAWYESEQSHDELVAKYGTQP